MGRLPVQFGGEGEGPRRRAEGEGQLRKGGVQNWDRWKQETDAEIKERRSGNNPAHIFASRQGCSKEQTKVLTKSESEIPIRKCR